MYLISIIIITWEIIFYSFSFQWLGNLRSKRINNKDSAEEAILNTSIKCIRSTKASRKINFANNTKHRSKYVTLSFNSIVYATNPQQQLRTIEVHFYEDQYCVIHRSGAIHASRSGMWSTSGSYELPNMGIHFYTHIFF